MVNMRAFEGVVDLERCLAFEGDMSELEYWWLVEAMLRSLMWEGPA